MTKHVPLSGSARKLMHKSRPIGPVDVNEVASLTIRVCSRREPNELAKKVEELSKLPLADRKYLTHDELETQYGSSQEHFDQIESYAHDHNLMVVHRSALDRSIVLKGRLGDLLSAFPADVRMFDHSTGTYRGRVGEISIPAQFEGIITGVFGFDTRPRHRSPHRLKSLALAGPGAQNGRRPQEFASRYNFPDKATNGAVLDGTGQTIAIIELGGGYRATDLNAYFQEIGVALPTVSAISVDLAGNTPSGPNSADGEVMLDIEVAGAVVPKAKIAVYFAPNVGDKGFIDAISAAIHDRVRKPGVISISWGGPERTNDQQGLDAYHELFAAAGALGITVCAASGDHGVADLSESDWDGEVHVDHPACDDLVLGCGGTQIDGNNADVVWNDQTPFSPGRTGNGGWASGGGISLTFPVPSYQESAGLPASIVDQKTRGRGVPDIAMSATDYFTRVDTTEGPSGGTSAVAPLMGALVARLNQALGKNVGFLNPFLYANADKGAVKDVVQGDNGILNTVEGYTAQKGWDACTGLGTPDGAAILSLLVKGAVGAPAPAAAPARAKALA